MNTPGRATRVVTVLAVLLVAAIAAIVSYSHMQQVAEQAGEGWRSHLIPLSIDGLIVAASMVLVDRRREGEPGGWLAWSALLGAVGASLMANVASADPTTTARLVAAWPAVAFAVALELMLQQRGTTRDDPADRVGELDELADRTRVLVAASNGKPVGRRTVARELGVSEHRARALLEYIGMNGGTR